MSHDLRLIDAIKANFARKSVAQLREIAGETDRDRWSPDAVAAANEVLQDRLAGRALEPDAPEADEEPSEFIYEPDAVELGVLAGLLMGVVIVPYRRRVEAPDLPVPFGRKMAWLSLATTDTAAVAAALPLRDATEATWGDGVEAAHAGAVYVTPPVGEWTLVAGTPLFQTPETAEGIVRPLLERLSRQFGEVQYFCHHDGVGLSVWARALEGRLLRGYGWLGARNLTLWEAGTATDEEAALGFRFDPGQPPQVEEGETGDLAPFPEDGVLQLAHLWSIDPTSLDEYLKEPGSGLLGTLTPAATAPRR